jgi:formylglycine-generating enzyme required for sulfatase activity
MVELEWILIPRGNFTYGLLPTQPPQRFTQPARKIFLDSFYISRYPITYTQIYEWATSNQRWAPVNIFPEGRVAAALDRFKTFSKEKSDHPATVNWHYAQGFCEWVGARLPTAMEWEKAARDTDGRLYPWGDEWDITKGNFYYDAENVSRRRASTPVTQYPAGASPYGVMDMMGNSFEYTISTAVSDDTSNPTELVVCRVSTFEYTKEQFDVLPQDNQVTITLLQPQNVGGYDNIGFRPVRTLWQQQALEKFK